jgi:hypothetical protein
MSIAPAFGRGNFFAHKGFSSVWAVHQQLFIELCL